VNILAIETATDVCGVALVHDGKALKECALYERHVHSEKLITLVDEVLQNSDGYDAIAVSIGPGSFTGLRIGLSVAKGLAYAGEKPLIAVPTMEALAFRAILDNVAGDGDEVIAMIDARRNDVYGAAYQVNGQELTPLWDVQALSLPAVAQRLQPEEKIVFIGDGIEKFRRFVKGENSTQWLFPPRMHQSCSAVAVGSVGARKAQRGELANVSSLEPMYVKDFVTLVHTQHPS